MRLLNNNKEQTVEVFGRLEETKRQSSKTIVFGETDRRAWNEKDLPVKKILLHEPKDVARAEETSRG